MLSIENQTYDTIFCTYVALVIRLLLLSLTVLRIQWPRQQLVLPSLLLLLSKWISKVPRAWELGERTNGKCFFFLNMKMKHADHSINTHNYQHRTILFRIQYVHTHWTRREEQATNKNCSHACSTHAHIHIAAWKYVDANMRYAIFQIAILCSSSIVSHCAKCLLYYFHSLNE